MNANNFLIETRLECISRSGMITIDHPYDGSNFDVIFLCACNAVKDISYNMTLEEISNMIVTKFMTIFHNHFVIKQHFNWL